MGLISTVHELSSREKSWLSRDSNPGPLGEKRERYLCAMQTPQEVKKFTTGIETRDPIIYRQPLYPYATTTSRH